MKRFLFICLFLSSHAFGMEAGMLPLPGPSFFPPTVVSIPPNGTLDPLRGPLEHLACAAYEKNMEAALVCMDDVEKKVESEPQTNLLLCLKQSGAYTHVGNLSCGEISSSNEAELLGRFGALLLKDDQGDDFDLREGLNFVQVSLGSQQLSVEAKRRVREIKERYHERLGIKKKKKKTRRKKQNAESDAQQGENIAQPIRFLTKERLLSPKRPPEEPKELPKKKKKKAKKKKKKESPLDMSKFTGSWDEVVMKVLGKPYTSYEQAIGCLTRPNTSFEIADPRLKKMLVDQLRGTIPTHDDPGRQRVKADKFLTVLQQDCYVLGRLLIENAGDEANLTQDEKDLPFKFIHAAVRANYTPAKLYLAGCKGTGLTKRRRVLHLMDAFKKGLKKGEMKQALEIADGYIREGYFLPLLARISRAAESGTLDAYLDELEKDFPPIRIYHTDEEYKNIVLHSPFKKGANTHWSAQAIRATMNSIHLLRAIESSNGTDTEITLKKMSDEVIAIDTLSQEHPELSALCGSCYSLLGRAYGWCGDMNNALKAHGKAMLDSGYHEATLLPYVRYVLHPKNGVKIAEKGNSEFIKKCLEMLVNGAENYKISAYLLYAAFHSHKNDMEAAECFAQKAGKQMEHEHNQDECMEEVYRQVRLEIHERKMNKQKRRTVAGVRKEKRQLKERVSDGFSSVSRVIELAEHEAEKNPLEALFYLRQAAFTENMFGMLGIHENLRVCYAAVIAKIQQADVEAACKEQIETIVQELQGKQQQVDSLCTRENGTCAVPIPREKD
ncbi:hypothetical protein E3J61_01550 [Candidatus Dependentiae bacterium]|nr:MAG: hypothetical protein E3J61_01550 [Candidatus Dependentiae bacterium]